MSRRGTCPRGAAPRGGARRRFHPPTTTATTPTPAAHAASRAKAMRGCGQNSPFRRDSARESPDRDSVDPYWTYWHLSVGASGQFGRASCISYLIPIATTRQVEGCLYDLRARSAHPREG
jgi:hypothetical protein